jgi:membrane protein required for colicin V production
MNRLDMVIIIITSYSLIRGFFRGLIKEFASILAVLGGFYAAYTYYMEVSKALAVALSRFDPSHASLISFFLIFSAIFVGVSILGLVIKYLLNIAFLGLVDRMFGAGFGFVKAALISSVILIALTVFLPKSSDIVRNSILSPHVVFVAEKMATSIPKEMKNAFYSKLSVLKKDWGIDY